MRLLRQTQNVGRHHRRQHARDDQREEDGDGGGPAELDEELARNAAHERGGQKNGNQRRGGGDHRQSDLVGRFNCRLQRGFTHTQVAHDVFDFDNGVVDQNTDHQRHREQGHDIEREAHDRHRGKGGDDRQRQGRGRDEGRPPVTQEKPDDNDGEDGAFDQQHHRTFEVLDDRVDEIEGLGDGDVRVVRLQFLQHLAHAAGHLDFAGPACTNDFESDHRFAVEQGGRTLLGDGVADRCQLAETNPATIGQRDFHGADFFGGIHSANGPQCLLGAADIGAPPGGILLHLAQLARNIGRRGVQCEQPGRIEFDANLAADPADTGDSADAAHTEHGLGQRIVHQPRQGLVVHAGRCDGVGQDRRTGEIDAGNHRVLQFTGEIGADSRNGIANVVDAFLRRLLQTEFDRDNDCAFLGPGVDVLDALQRRDGVLDLAPDFGLHLRRSRTRQARRDGDGGQVDVRELLDLHPPESHQAEQGEHQEQQHRRNGVANGPG